MQFYLRAISRHCPCQSVAALGKVDRLEVHVVVNLNDSVVEVRTDLRR